MLKSSQSSSAIPRGMTSKSGLTAFEERILLRLSKGKHIHLESSGHGRLGPLTVPGSVIDKLMRRELVALRDGEVVLTRIGLAACDRLRAAQEPGLENQFIAQHQVRTRETREIDGAKQAVTVNKAESPLWWLRARRDKSGQPLITDLQFAAGEQLRQDWEMAQLGPRVCMSWSDAPPERGRRGAPSQPDLPPGALRAKERVAAAMEQCGAGLSDILIRVCCRQEGLSEAETALRWPRRSAKLILGFGLERLVDFYGLRAGRR
ncbi:MAG: DUF6456 domain-containing protein [Pseudomonadota bacterium]